MVIWIRVNIGSGNGLLSSETKPLLEPVLTNRQKSSAIHMSAISQEMFKTSQLDMSSNIIDLKLLSHRPGPIELISASLIILVVLNRSCNYCCKWPTWQLCECVCVSESEWMSEWASEPVSQSVSQSVIRWESQWESQWESVRESMRVSVGVYDNYTSNQRIIPINNFITTPRNYWFHGIYFRKWFMLILNITLVTLGRLTDISLNKNGGSREAVKKKGSVWVEGELIRRPFLTQRKLTQKPSHSRNELSLHLIFFEIFEIQNPANWDLLNREET